MMESERKSHLTSICDGKHRLCPVLIEHLPLQHLRLSHSRFCAYP